jgi:mono/diheme cytochrome c family protein
MKTRLLVVLAALMVAFGVLSVFAQPSNVTATAPVYVPDTTHQNDPLPEGVIAWDATLKAVDAVEGTDFAKFTFTFTNIAVNADITRMTNSLDGVTNVLVVTNSIAPCPITILNVHPGCGCTTADLPPVPWTLAPGEAGTMKFSVNLAGKQGTLFKTVTVTTDKGKRDLMLRINLTPAPKIEMTEEQKAAGIAAAKVDRQAVFKGDCASCHLKNVEGKYGQELFKNICAICHEAEHKATMVPDLGKLNVPTNVEFWRTWITYGKPGSLMPAFAKSQGGPLNDMQIASLAQYLAAIHPSAPANGEPAK